MASAGTAYVDVEAKLDSFASDLDAAISGLTAEVPITADTSEVDAALSSIEAAPVDVEVGADTAEAEAAIGSIDAPPIEQEINIDTSAAEQQISGLGDSMFQLGGASGDATGALDAFTGAALGVRSAGSIAATGGLAAMTAAFGMSVMNAMEAEVSLVQLEQIVSNMGTSAGVTSAGLQDMASDLQETAGFSDEAVMAGQSMVLMFENVRNIAGQPIFDRTIQSAADLARSPFGNGDIAASARTLGRALDNPSESFGRLARQGVTFTDAQKQAIIAMQESGDMAGAQAVLLDVLDGKIGGAADAYGQTLAGEVDRAKESIGEASEQIGGTMVPILGDLALVIGDVAEAFGSLDDATGGGLASSLAAGPALYKSLKDLFSGGDEVRAVGEVIGTLPSILLSAEDAAGSAAIATDEFAGAAGRTKEQIDGLTTVLHGYLDGTFLVPQAQRELRDSFDNLFAVLLTEGHTADDVAAALEKVAYETADLGGATGDTTAAVDGTVYALAVLANQTGDADGQIQGLINTLLGLPDDATVPTSAPGATEAEGEIDGVADTASNLNGTNAFVGVEVTGTADARTQIDAVGNDRDDLDGTNAFTGIIVTGTATARNAIDSVDRDLTDLDGNTADVFINVRTTGSANIRSAVGGPIAAGQLSLVGEEGPEFFVPNTGGNILPAENTARLMLDAQKNGGGGFSPTVNVYTAPGTDGQELARLITDELRKLERAGQ